MDDYFENGDFPGGLKDLRTNSPDVRDALYRVYANWIDVGDFDAFRIDTVKHVEASFWNEFCHRIRTHAAQIGKRNFLMVGEDLEGDSVKAGAYTQNDALDTVFNYPQKFVVDEVLNGKAPTQNLADVYAAVQKNFSQRPSESTSLTASQSTVNFLDNHDLGRFLASSSKPALKTALALILLEDGIPAIYYGTEQELSGKDDPNNREDLWKTKYATDGKTFGWIARLVKIRKAYPALRRGRLTFRMTTRNFASESDAGLLVFERSEGAQTVLVAINVSDSHPSTATGISVGLDEGTRLTDVLGGQKVTVGAARSLSLTVPPRETLILVRDSELVSGL